MTALALLGKGVGSNWESWRHNLGYVDYLIVVAVIAGVGYWLWRRRQGRNDDGDRDADRAEVAKSVE